ncbi:UvrD-helicase domain-containing protein [Candidatus Peregrinibacteria bacterium]|nr:UvrD-helicase domain-containing protein [Candidatus Peregrinibacteria bacterium]
MSELNKQQQDAVEHKDGPILVIAGAGTGKTRVITERIAHILKEKWCDNTQILALTFTDKAAGEMEERLDTLMPIGYETIQISTFHSFCEKLLRQYGIDIGISPSFQILEGVRQWQYLKEKLYDFDLKYYRPLGNPNKFISALISHFSKVKEELNSPEDYIRYAENSKNEAQDSKSEDELIESERLIELANAYKKYQELLAKDNYLDFSDLQYQLITLLKKRPNILHHLQSKFKYILVDEYQDTNIAQNTIVDLLAGEQKNIMVVGDDDQSIYKFRGAAISNILQFEEKYPDLKKVVLTNNYRSNQRILDFSYTSIQKNNPDRLEVKSNVNKKLTALRPGEDDSICLVHSSTIDQEVEYVIETIKKSDVNLSEIAILVRANNHAKPFIDALKKENIPYQFLSERGLYNKNEVKDLISVLRCIANQTDDISFFRVLRMPIFNISMETILGLIAQTKKDHNSLWSHIKKSPECKVLAKLLSEIIEYSKNHSVGEVLYKFTNDISLYESLLSHGTIEAEEQITNIATYFNKIREFERGADDPNTRAYIDYLDMAEEAGDNPSAKFDIEGKEGVQISTVHGAKGLEFHTVFLPSLVSGRFPSTNRSDLIPVPNELVSEILNEKDSNLEEERRLFYVAVTRAKEKLHLLHSNFYTSSNAKNPRSKKRSVFIDEIIDEVDVVNIEKTVEGVERFIKPKPTTESADYHPRLQEANKREILRFSHSALDTFETCPRKYEYGNILNIPQEMNGAASFGSSLHNTLNEFYKLVTQSKQASLFESYEEDLSLKKLLEIYEDKWIPYGFDSKEHHDTLKKRGKEILEGFYEHFKDEVSNIEFLEKGFKLKAGKYTITGRIDRADKLPDGTLEVIDYKSGKAKSQKDVDKDQQLMIYAMAVKECFNQTASKLTLYFLDEDIKVSTEPDEEKLEKFKDKIIEIADKVNESDFAPTPSKYICQFCAYRKICDKAEL